MSEPKLKVHVTMFDPIKNMDVVNMNRIFEQVCGEPCPPALDHTHEYPPKCRKCSTPFKEIT